MCFIDWIFIKRAIKYIANLVNKSTYDIIILKHIKDKEELALYILITGGLPP